MTDPVFWLGLSILLVAASLSAVLIAALPALQALARAARSLEKLADTLSREFPPTLETIRMTGLEISELTDDVSEGVQSAGQVVKQVDRTLDGAKKQAQKVQTTTGNIFTGFKVAWKTFRRPAPQQPPQIERLPPAAGSVSPPPPANRDRNLEAPYSYGNPEELYEESGGELPTSPYPRSDYKTLNSNRSEG